MRNPLTSALRARLAACLLLLLAGAGSATASPQGKAPAAPRPNVLFIAVDDLGDDIGPLGWAGAKTPQLDAFARSARVFTHHYVQVPTCGASRAVLLSGRYPTAPAALQNSAVRDTHVTWGAANLPAAFRAQGYRTLALGKITHYPGGLTGRAWAEGPEELPGAWDRAWVPQGPWTTPQAMMHGYARGAPRRPGQSLPFEKHDGPDDAYPDAWVAAEAAKTLRDLAGSPAPWFFAVGFFKPHLPFAAPGRWFDLHAGAAGGAAGSPRPAWPSGWHASTELLENYGTGGRDPRTDPEYAAFLRQARAASVSYVDAQIGRVLDALRDAGLAERTIVVIWGDNGFLLGEHGIWGKHCLYERAVRTPLLIRAPGLRRPGEASAAVVETVDLFPTLAELCRLPAPDGLDGRSLSPQLRDPAAPSTKAAVGFWTGGQRTVRTHRWRLIAGSGDGQADWLELFDYGDDPGETRNLARVRPDIVRELTLHLRRHGVGRAVLPR